MISSFSLITCIKCGWPLKAQYAYRKECRECGHTWWYGNYKSIHKIICDDDTLEIVTEIIQFLGTDPIQFFDVIDWATNRWGFLCKKWAKTWLPSWFRWVKDGMAAKKMRRKYPYVFDNYSAGMPIDWLTMRNMLFDFYDKNNTRKEAPRRDGESQQAPEENKDEEFIKTSIHFFLQEYGRILKWDVLELAEEDYKKREKASMCGIDYTDIDYLINSAEIHYNKIKKILEFYQYKGESMKTWRGARRSIIYN